MKQQRSNSEQETAWPREVWEVDVKQKSGSKMVEMAVPEGCYLKILPCSSSPSMPIF